MELRSLREEIKTLKHQLVLSDKAFKEADESNPIPQLNSEIEALKVKDSSFLPFVPVAHTRSGAAATTQGSEGRFGQETRRKTPRQHQVER